VAEAAGVGAAKTTGQAVAASVILHKNAPDSGDENILDLRNHVGRRGLAPLTGKKIRIPHTSALWTDRTPATDAPGHVATDRNVPRN
jgi:hypothetical protein